MRSSKASSRAVMRPNSGVRGVAAFDWVLLPCGRPRGRLVVETVCFLASAFALLAAFSASLHDLLDADRERAPLLDTDQGQCEEGETWHRLAIETGKEPIQAMSNFAGFGGHDFIAHQQVALISTVDMLTKELPKQHGPRERLREKALHGPITAASARPAGDTQHRHASRHHQQRRNNTAELMERCSGHSALEALQKC